jgi:hypothetical protein
MIGGFLVRRPNEIFISPDHKRPRPEVGSPRTYFRQSRNSCQGWNMEIASEQGRIQQEQAQRQSPSSSRAEGAWDARAQMRWVGVSACVLSAALMLASAALLALGL